MSIINEITNDQCIRNNCDENWYDYKTKILICHYMRCKKKFF